MASAATASCEVRDAAGAITLNRFHALNAGSGRLIEGQVVTTWKLAIAQLKAPDAVEHPGLVASKGPFP